MMTEQYVEQQMNGSMRAAFESCQTPPPPPPPPSPESKVDGLPLLKEDFYLQTVDEGHHQPLQQLQQKPDKANEDGDDLRPRIAFLLTRELTEPYAWRVVQANITPSKLAAKAVADSLEHPVARVMGPSMMLQLKAETPDPANKKGTTTTAAASKPIKLDDVGEDSLNDSVSTCARDHIPLLNSSGDTIHDVSGGDNGTPQLPPRKKRKM